MTGQPVDDLLTRAAELRGHQALTAVVFPGEPPAEPGFAERAAGSLGIHPPYSRASSAAAPAVLGAQADVHIAGQRPAGDRRPGLVIRTGAVSARTAAAREDAQAVADAISATGDPLDIRLALMSHSHDQPADLDQGALTRAGETTARWRDLVANWAESPSRPMAEQDRTELNAAFGDLDMPRALRLLSGLTQDDRVPEGARFETFAFADRILGLELARLVGRR